MIVVSGPTGSGKSELALRLAETLSGEIVGCDSVQIYRGFNIGSAKVLPEERRGIPHHLIDVAEPWETFTAGDYSRLARQAASQIAARRRVPIVAGGTGFYLRALLDGLFEGPVRDERMRSRLIAREEKRPGSLHKLLGRFDPVAAARIHANDVNKTVRALEISLLARQPMSELWLRGRDRLTGFRVLKIGIDPPRAGLYRRIDKRVSRMFEQGLVEETRSLLERGCSESAKPFESLGYRQAVRVLRGAMTVAEAVADTQLRTRQYAKRQWTWFRRDDEITWLAGFGDDRPLIDAATTRCHVFLSQI
jgi:tRNA dimethylallyltransferase